MPVNRGKQFEKLIQTTFENLALQVRCERLHDQVSGFVEVSKNPADFIVYKFPFEYYIECKSIHGASIPINNLVQLDRIRERCGVYGVFGKFIIWFVDKQETYWVDHKYLLVQRMLGKKSVNHEILKQAAKEGELVKLIPAQYKRVFGKYDFSDMWEKYYARTNSDTNSAK